MAITDNLPVLGMSEPQANAGTGDHPAQEHIDALTRAVQYMKGMYNTSTQGYQGKIQRQGQEAGEISNAVPRRGDK